MIRRLFQQHFTPNVPLIKVIVIVIISGTVTAREHAIVVFLVPLASVCTTVFAMCAQSNIIINNVTFKVIITIKERQSFKRRVLERTNPPTFDTLFKN
jgi:hypothetical protein